MTTRSGVFIYDSSHRLAFEMFDVEASEYPEYCKRVVDRFSLTSTSELVIALDQVSGGFTDGSRRIALDWDNWSGFIVTAKHAEADALVRQSHVS